LYLPSKTKIKYIIILALAVSLVVFPFKAAITTLVNFFSRQLVFTPANSRSEADTLKSKNLSLLLKLKGYESLSVENAKLKRALAFKKERYPELIGADVIGFSPSYWQRFIVINIGQDAGLKRGKFAIDENGNLIGKIITVEKESAQIALISDPNFTIPVFIGENSLGLLKGNFSGAQILYVEDGEGLKPGDKVWLKDPSSSAQVEIGKIRKVVNDANSLFWNIEVELFLQTSFFDKIFIIR